MLTKFPRRLKGDSLKGAQIHTFGKGAFFIYTIDPDVIFEAVPEMEEVKREDFSETKLWAKVGDRLRSAMKKFEEEQDICIHE